MKEDELFSVTSAIANDRYERKFPKVQRVLIKAKPWNAGFVIANSIPLSPGEDIYHETAKLILRFSIAGDGAIYIVYKDK